MVKSHKWMDIILQNYNINVKIIYKIKYTIHLQLTFSLILKLSSFTPNKEYFNLVLMVAMYFIFKLINEYNK